MIFFYPCCSIGKAKPTCVIAGEEQALVLLEQPQHLALLSQVLHLIANTLAESPTGIQDFFEGVIKQEGVPLLTTDVNLFARCLEQRRFHSRARLLLFAVFYFQAQGSNRAQPRLSSNQSFLDFFRVCRNITWSLEQPNRDEWLPSLRENGYHGLLQSFRYCFAKKHLYSHLAASKAAPIVTRGAVDHELLKGRLIRQDNRYQPLIQQLEDHPLLRGALHNFDLEHLSVEDLERQIDVFFYLWPAKKEGALDEGLCARALLAAGNYAQKIAGSALGWAWYFGKGRRWGRILRARDPRVRTALTSLLTALAATPLSEIRPTLEARIQKAASSVCLAPWCRAFLRYPSILESEANRVSFAFFSTAANDYRIEKILGKTLKSPHINVYVEALAQELGQTAGLVYGRNRESSCLQLDKGVQLYAENGGWHVYGLGIPSAALLERFALEVDARYTVKTLHKLAVGVEEDMVAVGKELVSVLLEK